MTDEQIRGFLVRITNCLQTILELEPQLKQLEMGHTLLDEFVVLKSFLENIDNVDLQEADVIRIEEATAHFLKELELPLAELQGDDESSAQLQ
ncbi:MAG: hypothetical protein ACNI27_09645 [Desulfovibrio sp.]